MDSAISVVQNQLGERMMGLFDLVLDERREHYAAHPEEVMDPSQVRLVIKNYTLVNTSVSAAIGLVPGPWGMVAAVPEIAVVLRNQLAMICDIGKAYGKADLLGKELLAGVLTTSMGLGGIGLLTMHGSKLVVKRTSLRAFQKVVSMMAGKITQQALKSALSKWVPVVGAAAMAAWSNVTTRQIGKRANDLLSRPIEVAEGELADGDVPVSGPGIEDDDGATAVQHISVLLNLAKKDGLCPEEKARLEEMISAAGLGDASAAALRSQLDSPGYSEVDYGLLRRSPDEALSLMIDMATLALADGRASAPERVSMREVGRLLGLPDQDVDEIIASRTQS